MPFSSLTPQAASAIAGTHSWISAGTCTAGISLIYSESTKDVLSISNHCSLILLVHLNKNAKTMAVMHLQALVGHQLHGVRCDNEHHQRILQLLGLAPSWSVRPPLGCSSAPYPVSASSTNCNCGCSSCRNQGGSHRCSPHTASWHGGAVIMSSHRRPAGLQTDSSGSCQGTGSATIKQAD